ncbi:MAG TPA: hypothetical protein VLA77_04455 [Candidatus Saccharimonadales bacterium]|nr:hypothetical protein [Candidatus Saccharimonadales bacterium]
MKLFELVGDAWSWFWGDLLDRVPFRSLPNVRVWLILLWLGPWFSPIKNALSGELTVLDKIAMVVFPILALSVAVRWIHTVRKRRKLVTEYLADLTKMRDVSHTAGFVNWLSSDEANRWFHRKFPRASLNRFMPERGVYGVPTQALAERVATYVVFCQERELRRLSRAAAKQDK